MPPAKTPYADKNPVVRGRRVFLRMLEPQSDADAGKKLSVGDVVVRDEAIAQRWVDIVGIAEVATEDDYNEYLSRIRAQADERQQGGFSNMVQGRTLNANQTNANFAALSRDPAAFDPSMLPRVNEEGVETAERRGMAARQGVRSSGRSFEEQLAELDRLEMEKGNIPISPGLQGDEFTPGGMSAQGNLVPQLGAVGRPGAGAPLFQDPALLDLDGDEDDEEYDEGDAPQVFKPARAARRRSSASKSKSAPSQSPAGPPKGPLTATTSEPIAPEGLDDKKD